MPIDIKRLREISDRIPTVPGAPRRSGGVGAVAASSDLERILALPKREIDFSRPPREWFDHLKVENPSCRCATWKRQCARELLPVQAWALYEAMRNEGMVGNIQVGAGKTLIGMLMPMVIPRCRVAVLLLQSKAQFLDADWPFYSQHWRLPNLARGRTFIPGRPVLHVLTYHELQHPDNSGLLESIGPDFIGMDEVHNIKDVSATRAKRVLRYAADHPDLVRVGGWSGTLLTNTILDGYHVCALALREGSPYPIEPEVAERWAEAVDPGLRDLTIAPGEMRRFCESRDETVRAGLCRRFVRTPGVVSTANDKDAIGSTLIISARDVKVPDEVKRLLRQVDGSWVRPDADEEFAELTEKQKCMRELACGFYYRWIWPRGEPVEVQDKWKAARKAWHRELRERLKDDAANADSPMLMRNAAIRWYAGGCPGCEREPRTPHKRGCAYAGEMPVWPSECWPMWHCVKDSAEPETEAVWVDDFLARDAAKWAKENVGIVWYLHDAFGQKIAEISKLPIYGAGDSAEIIKETGKRSIVASIHAHGVEKNLQMFRLSLITNLPSGGRVWEQLLGRTHRPFQPADTVEAIIYRHTPEVRGALEKARESAAFLQELLGGPQKLLYADYANFTP